MEGLVHFSHEHPLILSKYNNSPADALCRGCGDPIIINTYVYRCSTPLSNTREEYSSCTYYFLHKSCSTLPRVIQHDIHNAEHVLNLVLSDYLDHCGFCNKYVCVQFLYQCSICSISMCLKCSSLERDLNHASHDHTLTLLPLTSSHFCEACGTEGSKDFSYLCKTCLFWIHKSCASAPPTLIFKPHDIDHPLVLDYSLPQQYRKYKVSCDLCGEEVLHPRWLYYCADCRYFGHIKCVLSATGSGEDGNINEDVGDVDDPNLVHFSVSDNKPLVFYQLIQKFAENFSSSTDEKSGKAEKISHCRNGHSLILFDNFYSKDVGETESSERMICDGCVQPIQSPPDSFYGCLDCNFFLHTICAAELPREFQHASHPQHKLVRCDEIKKPNVFFSCGFCNNICNGMFYRCDSCEIYIDLVCTAMPTQIKHDAHKHKLEYSEYTFLYCTGCEWICTRSFRCKICDYKIDARCVRKPGRIMHRWDEHQLCLMYPPVKGHPHDFNCEFCSQDINPNIWFYHCRKCDTSFHADCLDQCRFPNIKFGAIVQYPDLHQHSLKISMVERIYTCGRCGVYRDPWLRGPILACVSCKFSVCDFCTPFKVADTS
ncbi:hypothetical protein AgCh_027298 [Apium graveolens]